MTIGSTDTAACEQELLDINADLRHGAKSALLMRRAGVYQKLGRLQEAAHDVRRAASMLAASDADGMSAARSQLEALNAQLTELSVKESPEQLLRTFCATETSASLPERRECGQKLCAMVADTQFCRRWAQDGALADIVRIIAVDEVSDRDAAKALIPLAATLCHRLTPYTDVTLVQSLLSEQRWQRWHEMLTSSDPTASDIISSVCTLSAVALKPRSSESSATYDNDEKVLASQLLQLIKTAVSLDSDAVVAAAVGHLTRVLGDIGPSVVLVKWIAADADLLLRMAVTCHSRKCNSQWTMFLAKAWELSRVDPETASAWTDALLRLFNALLESGKATDRIIALDTLSIVFQIGTEFGAKILSCEGVLEQIVDCAEFESDAFQLATLEMLSHASADKSCRARIADVCAEYLATASTHKIAAIKTAATVVLTKIESFAPVQDQAHSVDMAKGLIGAVKSTPSTASSSIEGLAFLAANPAVKELIVGDVALLKALFDLVRAKDTSGTTALVYGVSQILVAVSSYRKQKSAEEEQVHKLRVFAKDAAPEVNDARDDDPAVEKRNRALASAGILGTARQLAKSSSHNVQHAAAQIYLNLATDSKLRGTMVQGGAVSGLLAICSAHIKQAADYVPFSAAAAAQSPVALTAAQALAKLAISLDPSIAFATTAASLVRPLMYLAQSESDLQVFESLLALTNLASAPVSQQTEATDTSTHARIMKAHGARVFQHHQFSDNTLVRRAATEALCNMMMYDPMARLYLEYAAVPGNGHVKMMMALSDADDMETRRAASAVLAILCSRTVTQRDSVLGEYLLKEERGMEIVMRLLADDSVEIVLRGVETMRCLLTHRSLAERIVKERISAEELRGTVRRLVQTCPHPVVVQSAQEILRVLDSYNL